MAPSSGGNSDLQRKLTPQCQFALHSCAFHRVYAKLCPLPFNQPYSNLLLWDANGSKQNVKSPA